ncbi:hypothetical protein DEU56DRAFT_716220, partial [Suillus clintonianus]|uniref:uncharacterized protein n=1 Tax=Suillus clintonianus TaxID=1904413 RepID=UPI001B862A2F
WDATITQNDQIIRFSSNSTHALHNPAELIESSRHHDRRSTSFSLGVDGWMLGPNRQLLFWVPLGLRQPFYTPRTVLVIPRGNTELYLSRMAHGQHWRNCRD